MSQHPNTGPNPGTGPTATPGNPAPPEVPDHAGNPGPARIHRCARDEDAARRLWELSVELTGADLPF